MLREWDARSGRQLLAIPSLGSGAVASNGAGLVTVGNDDQQTGAVVDLAPRGRARSGGHVPGRHRLEHPRRRQWRRRRANDVWRRERRLGHDLPPRHRRWRHAADGARPRGEHAGNGAGRHTVRRPRRQRRRERRDDGARPAHRRCPRAARSSRGCTLDAAAALVAGQRTDRRRHGHCVGGVGRRHGRARCTPPMRAATAWSSSTRIFTPDSSTIVATTNDRRIVSRDVRSWSVRTERTQGLTGGEVVSHCSATAPMARDCWRSGGTSGTPAARSVWLDAQRFDQVLAADVGDGSITSAAMSQSGRRAATAAVDGTVRVWDVDLGTQVAEIPLDRAVVGVALLDDAHLAVSPGEGGVLLEHDRCRRAPGDRPGLVDEGVHRWPSAAASGSARTVPRWPSWVVRSRRAEDSAAVEETSTRWSWTTDGARHGVRGLVPEHPRHRGPAGGGGRLRGSRQRPCRRLHADARRRALRPRQRSASGRTSGRDLPDT